MTSQSRRLCLHLVLPTLLCLCLTAAAPTNAQEPKTIVLPAISDVAESPAAPLQREREEIWRLLNAQARASRPTTMDDEDAFYFKVETEPPTRERLFTLRSQEQLLRAIESEFKEKDPNQIFLLPAPIDIFSGPDASTLGSMWWQNDKTGRGVDRAAERRGEMKVAKGTGVFDVGAKAEASIINESVGSEDMQVRVDVQLGGAQAQFGLLFRAADPTNWQDLDQIESNTFYYAVFSETEVTVGKFEAGKNSALHKAKLEPKTKFQASLTAFGPEIKVYRDHGQVLQLTDDSITGRFAGVIGLKAGQTPTIFDEFFAVRYGGPFVARSYAQTTTMYEGANVLYHPLYFEQVGLERYGHHLGNLFQPFVAHGEFFFDIIALPYSMGKSCPWEWHSDVGYAKPGDIVLPFRIYLPVWDTKGITLQTAVTALSFALLP